MRGLRLGLLHGLRRLLEFPREGGWMFSFFRRVAACRRFVFFFPRRGGTFEARFQMVTLQWIMLHCYPVA